MANQFVTLQEIARTALPILRDALVFPALIHTDFSDCSLNRGETVQVRKPSVFRAETFDPDSGVSPQDFQEISIPVTLDKIATVDVEVSALQSATSLSDLENQFILPAAAAIADKINADGLALYKSVPNVCGTPGTPVSSLEDYADIRRALNLLKVPPAPRRAVWGVASDAALTKIAAFVNAEKTGDNKALRDGSIGRLFGIDNFMSQSVVNHIAGTLSGTLTVTADVSDSPTVSISGGAGTLFAGDILTINDQSFTVLSDVNVSAASVEVPIYPSVTASAGDPITLLGDHTANLVFHPMAFAYITRPLPAPAGVSSYVTSYDGLTLRVTRGYDMRFKKELLSMDVLYGFAPLYPELAIRALS